MSKKKIDNLDVLQEEINIPEDALELLSKDAFADVCTGGNPREITEKDILDLYKKVY
jgi:lactaldehyde reductase